MSKKDEYHCEECGNKLKTKNDRIETQDGIRYCRVDYWCVNEKCARFNQLGVIDKKNRIKSCLSERLTKS